MGAGRAVLLKTTCRQGMLVLSTGSLQLRARIGAAADQGWTVARTVVATVDVHYRSEFGWDLCIHTRDGRVLRADWVPPRPAEKLLAQLQADQLLPPLAAHTMDGMDGMDGMDALPAPSHADMDAPMDTHAELERRPETRSPAPVGVARPIYAGGGADRGVQATLAAAAAVALMLMLLAGGGAAAGSIRLLALLLLAVTVGAGILTRWGARPVSAVSAAALPGELHDDGRLALAAAVAAARACGIYLRARLDARLDALLTEAERWRAAWRNREQPEHARSWLVPFGTGAGALLLACSICALCALTAQGALLAKAPANLPRSNGLAQIEGPLLPTATPAPTATRTPRPKPTATPRPTPTPAPPPAPAPLPTPVPPPPAALTITFTCASAVDLGAGQVCVHTLPNAALSIRIVYACGQVANNKSLQGVKHANGSGDFAWSWRPQTSCPGPATATVTAQWQGQTAVSSITFTVARPNGL